MIPPKNQTMIDHRSRVGRVMTYIDQNLDQPRSLESLAREACFSPFYFNRVFAGCTGETLSRYWMRGRMQTAAQRLMSSNQRVIDIALAIGYESHNAFSKAFRNWYGISPRAYRDNPIGINSWGYESRRSNAYHTTYSSSRFFVCRMAPHPFTLLPLDSILKAEGQQMSAVLIRPEKH